MKHSECSIEEKQMKKYTICKTHNGRKVGFTGTLEHLVKNVFSYTIASGCMWNRKLNRNPKSGKALVTLLNACVQETQRACFERDHYELVN